MINESDMINESGTTGQCVYAVLSIDQFLLLRSETDYCVSVLHQLRTVADRLMSHQVNGSFYRASLCKARYNAGLSGWVLQKVQHFEV